MRFARLSSVVESCKRVLAITIVVIVNSNHAFGACASPTGKAGEMTYSSPEWQYCDGTNWNSMTSTVTATSCTTPGAMTLSSAQPHFCNASNVLVGVNNGNLMGRCSYTAGALFYDTTQSRVKWCDGLNARAVGGTGGAATLSYLGTALSNPSGTSVTFATQPLGAAEPSRYIIVGVVARSAAAIDLAGVNVGGVDGTRIFSYTNSFSVVAFYGVHLPTGTAGDVITNFTVAASRAAIVIWNATNIQSLSPTSV